MRVKSRFGRNIFPNRGMMVRIMGENRVRSSLVLLAGGFFFSFFYYPRGRPAPVLPRARFGGLLLTRTRNAGLDADFPQFFLFLTLFALDCHLPFANAQSIFPLGSAAGFGALAMIRQRPSAGGPGGPRCGRRSRWCAVRKFVRFFLYQSENKFRGGKGGKVENFSCHPTNTSCYDRGGKGGKGGKQNLYGK